MFRHTVQMQAIFFDRDDLHDIRNALDICKTEGKLVRSDIIAFIDGCLAEQGAR